MQEILDPVYQYMFVYTCEKKTNALALFLNTRPNWIELSFFNVYILNKSWALKVAEKYHPHIQKLFYLPLISLISIHLLVLLVLVVLLKFKTNKQTKNNLKLLSCSI